MQVRGRATPTQARTHAAALGREPLQAAAEKQGRDGRETGGARGEVLGLATAALRQLRGTEGDATRRRGRWSGEVTRKGTQGPLKPGA